MYPTRPLQPQAELYWMVSSSPECPSYSLKHLSFWFSSLNSWYFWGSKIKFQVKIVNLLLSSTHSGWTWFIQLVVCSRGPCLESISLSHGYRPTLKKVYPEPYTYPHHISEVLWIDVSPMEGMFYWPELMQEHWYHLQL